MIKKYIYPSYHKNVFQESLVLKNQLGEISFTSMLGICWKLCCTNCPLFLCCHFFPLFSQLYFHISTTVLSHSYPFYLFVFVLMVHASHLVVCSLMDYGNSEVLLCSETVGAKPKLN